MQVSKTDAETMLDVSYTTFYNRVKKLKVTMITKVDYEGKRSYIEMSDLQKIAEAMGKPLGPIPTWEEKESRPENEGNENKNGAVAQAEIQIEQQEIFWLQLKIKEKDEALKASNEFISFYKNENEELKMQEQQRQSQFQAMYWQFIVISNKATAFRIACIALAIILILFVGLVVLGKLRF